MSDDKGECNMTPEAITEHLRAEPFVPCRIFLSDGASYDVRHPELVFILHRKVIIALPRPGETYARHSATCDPMHITRIEPINGDDKTKGKGKNGRTPRKKTDE